MNYTLGKKERLKSRKLIERLYKEGKVIKVFPLRMVYLRVDDSEEKFDTKFGVSVPKRNFKRAVDRNRIKRLLRESYRSQRNTVHSQINCSYVYMVSYLAKDEWSYLDIKTKMNQLLTKFVKEIQQ